MISDSAAKLYFPPLSRILIPCIIPPQSGQDLSSVSGMGASLPFVVVCAIVAQRGGLTIAIADNPNTSIRPYLAGALTPRRRGPVEQRNRALHGSPLIERHSSAAGPAARLCTTG